MDAKEAVHERSTGTNKIARLAVEDAYNALWAVMGDRDVEIGMLSVRPSEPSSKPGILSLPDTLGLPYPLRTRRQASPDDADLQAGKEPTTTDKETATGGSPTAMLEGDDTVTLPRRKIEQLMGMWIDVLQQSLQSRDIEQKIHTIPIRTAHGSMRQLVSPASNSRYPPISYPPDAHPWATVEPMAEFEIEAEDGWRSLGRSMWKNPANLAHLEDSWKHLWEPMIGVDKGLFQWAVGEETRMTLQYNLVDALNANERIVSANMFMRRDYRTISTFITLIGLRLNEQFRSYHRSPEMGPVQQIKILIECIWACNAFDPSNDIKKGFREGPRLSNVLTACYRRGILNRPEEGFDDYVTRTILRRQCQAVRRALHLINLLHKQQLSVDMPCDNMDQARALWSMPLPDVEAPLPQIPRRISTLRDGAEAFLRIDDFNLKDLQTLGHLQIQWTSYWDEHLELETGPTANTLKIYWFQPKLARYLVENHLCAQLSSAELTRHEDELFRTWCLLFTSKSRPRHSHARYHSLRAPRWLSLLAHSSLTTWTPEQATNNSPDAGPLLSKFTSPSPSNSNSTSNNSNSNSYCLEMQDHLLLHWSPNGKLPHERISYSQFPVYAHRLRELRTYMDSQQPTGLRALWNDRRNSNTYYTFWFVAIFGSLSVFLAACALAVGIAQTWAAFRALDA